MVYSLISRNFQSPLEPCQLINFGRGDVVFQPRIAENDSANGRRPVNPNFTVHPMIDMTEWGKFDH